MIKRSCLHCENGLLNHIPLEVTARERAYSREGITHFNESPVSPPSGKWVMIVSAQTITLSQSKETNLK